MESQSSLPQSSESTNDLGLEDPKATELSGEFVVRWSRLVSTTNWEKGQIIYQWREALMGSESPASSYSDEAWSRRVGGVSAQHVGRLRRVHERFGDCHKTYNGLYWTHFLAALDWDDAEMWLEGAVQSEWSVAEMRRTRWQSTGSVPSQQPVEGDLRLAGEDEDFSPLTQVDGSTDADNDPYDVQQAGPRYDDPDFGDEPMEEKSISTADDELAPWEDDSDPASKPAATESPFARLPALPVDLAEALEQFKLAIIRHRSLGWAEVPKNHVLTALDALQSFALQ
jgi:hypothetical protein